AGPTRLRRETRRDERRETRDERRDETRRGCLSPGHARARPRVLGFCPAQSGRTKACARLRACTARGLPSPNRRPKAAGDGEGRERDTEDTEAIYLPFLAVIFRLFPSPEPGALAGRFG